MTHPRSPVSLEETAVGKKKLLLPLYYTCSWSWCFGWLNYLQFLVGHGAVGG